MIGEYVHRSGLGGASGRSRRLGSVTALFTVAFFAGLGLAALVSPRARGALLRLVKRRPELPAGAVHGANEGEGSRSADRRYRESTAAYVRSGKVAPAAAAARRALEGPEGAELRDAERAGKQRASSTP